jgi:hypothetical protein
MILIGFFTSFVILKEMEIYDLSSEGESDFKENNELKDDENCERDKSDEIGVSWNDDSKSSYLKTISNN